MVLPASPAELANAMRQLWQDPAQARRYGEQAPERFNALFIQRGWSVAMLISTSKLAGHGKG